MIIRFFKEYAILLFIILFVILIETITDNITRQSIEDINNNISQLENALESDNVEEKIDDLFLAWKKEEGKLSFYMEHNELEKVSVLVDNVKANIKTKSMEEINEEISEIKFMLEHIKEKQKLELKNIF